MREVRDGARHAGIVEGQSGPVSDLCWRYLGVVKAGEIEAGQWLRVNFDQIVKETWGFFQRKPREKPPRLF